MTDINTESHTGSCHCGKVRYEVRGDLSKVISCNCSRCGRLGALLAFVPVDAFTLLAGQDALTDYRFNTHKIHHVFCKHCGIESFARGTAPDGKTMAAINVRCVEGIDLDALQVSKIDGKSR